jgi:hypothetical protein
MIAYHVKCWQIKNVHMLLLCLSLLISSVVYYTYHSYAANGGGWRSIRDIASRYLPIPQTNNVQIIKGSNPDIPIVEYSVTRADFSKAFNLDLGNRSALVKVGVGADFMEVEWDGKIFRVIQYLTQFMILVGGVWLLKGYNVPNEYLGLVGGSVVLLVMCIIMPGISNIINMSRFYHLSLFFIAPLFVLGCECIANTIESICVGGDNA